MKKSCYYGNYQHSFYEVTVSAMGKTFGQKLVCCACIRIKIEYIYLWENN